MNTYCDSLGIEAPRLESFHSNPEVNTYTRLILALLERGGPMTLVEVADRFEEAGVAYFDNELLALQRCKPDRAPVVRDGDAQAATGLAIEDPALVGAGAAGRHGRASSVRPEGLSDEDYRATTN